MSLLCLAPGDTRDKPSTITAHRYLVIKGLQPLQPLPDVVINAGGLSSHYGSYLQSNNMYRHKSMLYSLKELSEGYGFYSLLFTK